MSPSTKAGTLPAGLIFRNASPWCSPATRLTTTDSNATPSSCSVHRARIERVGANSNSFMAPSNFPRPSELLASVGETAGRGRVRQRPAEVHFRVHQLAVTNSQDFGISKAIAASVSPFVGHEHALALLREMDEPEVGGVRAVGPATL